MNTTALRIAVRYLFCRKRHGAVNVISWISIAGVAVATAAIVCVLSVFNGFSSLAGQRLSVIDPDIRVSASRGKTIADGDSLAEALAALPEFAAAAPVVEEHVLAIFAGRQMPVTVKGIPPGYSAINDYSTIIIDGEMFPDSSGSAPGAALSVGVAVSLNARPGFLEPLYVYAPRRVGRVNVANPMGAFRGDTLSVSGVYEVEQTDYDLDRAVVPLSTARKLLEYTTEATAVELKIAPGVSEERAMQVAAQALGGGYSVENRLMQQSESFRMIAVEKWITFLMLVFILVISSFNVLSSMSMLVIEKRYNLSTLRALGATAGCVRSIFLWEGWLITLLGGAAGIALGIGLSLAQQYGGFIKLSGDPSQLTISAYPAALEWSDVCVVALLVTAVGLFIGLIASRFASPRTTAPTPDLANSPG